MLDSNNKIKDIIILIPAYNPNAEFINFCSALLNHFEKIVVVNDGSVNKYLDNFPNNSLNNSLYIYNHIVNMGKGRALKNAINYSFNIFKKNIINNEILGFVTVDADGQHQISDIINVCDALHKNSNNLILGTRKFDIDVPFRSKFGNLITSFIVKLLYGKKISDTQTGLRAFSIELSKMYANLFGERYEYEITMLIESIRNKIEMLEIPISTIYINDNSESHFNPIVDSYRIYKVIFSYFFKYSIVSILSFLFDSTVFYLLISNLFFNKKIYNLFIASIIARFLSSLFNYFANKTYVYNSDSKHTIFKYYALVIINLLVSTILVSIFSINVNNNNLILIIKIIVDCIIYFINYRIVQVIFNN